MQNTLVIVFVGVAVLYVLWATSRTWFGSRSGCGSGCGSCATEEKHTGRIGLQLVDLKLRSKPPHGEAIAKTDGSSLS